MVSPLCLPPSNTQKEHTMKKTSKIFEIIRTELHSIKFLNDCKLFPKAFLRNRLLPLPVIFLFILNLLKKSIPNELVFFCEYCEIPESSRSAVTQARAKLSPNAFIKLNDILLKEFYNDNDFRTFQGLIILSMDSSTGQLPDSFQLSQKYGYASNQTKKKFPMARISQLFDVLNGITWDAKIVPYSIGERDIAIQHLEAIKQLGIDLKNILIIFDRGYPSLPLIVYLLKNGINFLMRSSRKFLKEVNEVVKSNKKDTTIEICLKRASPAAKAELNRLFPCVDFKDTITIRVVVATLSTGEEEILITSLLDKEQYPYKIFLKLYFKRWGVEESYKFYKSCIEIENFSGKSCVVIEQDFHAAVLASNARALLALEAEEEMTVLRDNSGTKEVKKYTYEINKKVSMEGLKNEFVAALLDPKVDLEHFCIKIKKKMKNNLYPIRPGRSFKRIRKHPHRKYHMNKR